MASFAAKRSTASQLTRILLACVLLFALPVHSALAPGDAADTEALLNPAWTGDLDAMVERGRIRALVVYCKTNYFLDGGTQRGLTYESLKHFEKLLNKDFKRPKHRPVQIQFVPVARHELFQALQDGRGDIAAANLTITEERGQMVDFAKPWRSDVAEILITGADAPPAGSVDDLSGREVYVRPSSSYAESLKALNERLRKEGRPEVQVRDADEYLEDEDLLEMVNAGLIPATIIDSHKAEFWKDIFPNIRLHPAVAVRTGGEIAWAIRKDSPKLKAYIDKQVAKHQKGTLLHNMLLKRYLKDNKWVKNAANKKDRERFEATIDLFRRYAGEYDFDWLIVAAQAYQESGIDQSVRSPAGAVGVMQLLPSTAKDPNVGIPNIHKIDRNIEAGVKYMRFLMSQYFAGEPMDRLNQGLFAVASYNAGPAKIRQLRGIAEKRGLNPNVWFNNVEVIAAEKIGRETVQYVSNIYKYYLAYKLIVEQLDRKEEAKAKTGS